MQVLKKLQMQCWLRVLFKINTTKSVTDRVPQRVIFCGALSFCDICQKTNDNIVDKAEKLLSY